MVLSPGVLSGRVENGDGTAKFVLGLISSYELELMTTGDYVQISQDVDLTSQDVIEIDCSAIGRQTSESWVAKAFIAGTLFIDRTIDPGDELSWVDFKIPVRRYDGINSVAIRLELVEV
jgi:hypothetical protein